MKKIIIIIGLTIILAGCNNSQNTIQPSKSDKSPKVILISIDGLRWQEVFTGADSLLVDNKNFIKDKTEDLKKRYWHETPQERRVALMPFVWNFIANNGQIYGNRTLGNKVNVANTHWFSYPGYSEILCGFADNAHINSNDKKNNPNKTILEIANTQERYNGKVAAFCSWDVFPYIINRERAKIHLNAGFEPAQDTKLSTTEKILNKLQGETPSPWATVRLDAFTHNYAMEYMKREQPKFLYIAYGETDDFAHDGRYDAYLDAIKRTDKFIQEIWDFTQQNPFYKDNTTFIITTDHGRGTSPIEEWKSHGQNLKYHGKTFNIKGSDETWIMAIGKGVDAKGIINEEVQLYNKQIAVTIAKILEISLPQNSKMNKEVLPFIK